MHQISLMLIKNQIRTASLAANFMHWVSLVLFLVLTFLLNQGKNVYHFYYLYYFYVKINVNWFCFVQHWSNFLVIIFEQAVYQSSFSGIDCTWKKRNYFLLPYKTMLKFRCMNSKLNN